MANISDAYGTIEVDKIGQEFLDFLEVAQDGAYYRLVEDVIDAKPDEDGNLDFTFFAGGRWNYLSNIDGYLNGNWMNDDKTEEAHNKLMEALEKKGGLISISYKDSDVGMDWMGEGVFEIYYEDGELISGESFEEESVTLERFAERNGESVEWALEYIYGDEVAEAYDEYVEACKEDGKQPEDPEFWLEEVYEEV